MSCRGPRKLFVRIYAHAIFLLLMIFASMFAISTCNGGLRQSIFSKLGRYTASLCERAIDGGKAERTELERFAKYADAPISCFGRGGKLLLRVGNALPAIDAKDERCLASGESFTYDSSPHRVALPIRDSAGKLRGYALVGHDPHATLGQILTKLGVVLLVL
ncbi:MAG: hypothetical protein KC503_23590, partial [Myxococcales bacterium]|nr:hypothetical protein [Myxococcales bacterium]